MPFRSSARTRCFIGASIRSFGRPSALPARWPPINAITVRSFATCTGSIVARPRMECAAAVAEAYSAAVWLDGGDRDRLKDPQRSGPAAADANGSRSTKSQPTGRAGDEGTGVWDRSAPHRDQAREYDPNERPAARGLFRRERSRRPAAAETYSERGGSVDSRG